MIFNKQVQLKAFTCVLQLWFILIVDSLPIIYNSITDNVNIVCPLILNDSVQNGFLHRIVACSFDTQNCSYQIDGFVKSIDLPSSKFINSSFYPSNGIGYIYGNTGSFRFKFYKKYFLDIHNFDVYLTMAYYVDGTASWNYYISMSNDQNEHYSYTYITKNTSSSDLWNILNARFNLTDSAMNSNFTFNIYGSGGFIKFDDLCIYQVCKEGYMFNESTNQCEDIIECATTCNWMYSSCTNTPGSYMCTCNVGFQLDINKTSCIDTCVSACHPNATCVGLNCNCNSGFIGNGFNNCKATCLSECHPNASCVGTSCICHSSFIGDGVSICEATCSSLCHPNATCVDTSCVCKKGFLGDGVRVCEASCSGACHLNATCIDTTCVCNNGYIGDGMNNCTASCLSICHRNAICVDTTCVCNNGFIGDGISNCTASCSGECHPNATCVDTTCVCNNGFIGDGISNCTGECYPNATCVDTTCVCNNGFIGDGISNCTGECYPNATCVDTTCVCNNGFIGDGISNCTASCSGECHSNATCVDTTCVCNNGFIGDGISNCTASCSGECHPNATCVDTTCVCNNGFIGDGISNCTASCSGECHPNATCVDTTCVCNNGFIGDGISNCTASCSGECHPNATCVDTTCVCNNGFIGDGISNCTASCSGECHPNATCVDTTCVCNNGFIGDGISNCTEKSILLKPQLSTAFSTFAIYHLTTANLSTANLSTLTTLKQLTTITTTYQDNEFTSKAIYHSTTANLSTALSLTTPMQSTTMLQSNDLTTEASTLSSTITLPHSTTPFATSTNLSTMISSTSPVISTTLTTMYQIMDLSTKEKEYCDCLLNLCYYHQSSNYCLRVFKSCSFTSTVSSITTLPPSTTPLTTTNLSTTMSSTSPIESTTLTTMHQIKDLTTEEKVYCNCLLNLCYYHQSSNYCLRVFKSCSLTSTASSTTTLSPSTKPLTTTANLSTTMFSTSPIKSTSLTPMYQIEELTTKEKVYCDCLLNFCYYHQSSNYCLRVFKSCSFTSTISSITTLSPTSTPLNTTTILSTTMSSTSPIESTTPTTMYQIKDLTTEEKVFCNCLLNLCYYLQSSNYCLRVFKSCSFTSTISSITTLSPTSTPLNTTTILSTTMSSTSPIESTTPTTMYQIKDLTTEEKVYCDCLLNFCYYHQSSNYCLRVFKSCSFTSTISSITTLSPTSTPLNTTTILSTTMSSTSPIESTTPTTMYQIKDLTTEEKVFCNCLLNLCYYLQSSNYCLRVFKSCSFTSTISSITTLSPTSTPLNTTTILSTTMSSTSPIESTTPTTMYQIKDLTTEEKVYCDCLLNFCYYHQSSNYCLRVFKSCSFTSTISSITTLSPTSTPLNTTTILSTTMSSTSPIESTTPTTMYQIKDLTTEEKVYCDCLLNFCYYHQSSNYCLRVFKSCSFTSTISSITTLSPTSTPLNTTTILSTTMSSTSPIESTTPTTMYQIKDLTTEEKVYCDCLLNFCYYHQSSNYCLRVFKSCSFTSTISSITTLSPTSTPLNTTTILSTTMSSTSPIESTTPTTMYQIKDLTTEEKVFCNCLLNLCYYLQSSNYCLRVLKSCSFMSIVSSTTSLYPSITPLTTTTNLSTTMSSTSPIKLTTLTTIYQIRDLTTDVSSTTSLYPSTISSTTTTNLSTAMSSTSPIESTTLATMYQIKNLTTEEKEFCNCLLNLCYYHMSLNYCLRVLKSCSNTSTTPIPTLPPSTTASVKPTTLTSTSRLVDLSIKEKEFCNCLLKLCYYHKSLNYCLRVLNSCLTTPTTSSTTLALSKTTSVKPTTLTSIKPTTSTFRLVHLSIKEKEFCNCLLNLCYYHISLNYCLRVLNSCLTTSTTSSPTLPPSTTASVEPSTLTSTSRIVDLSIKEKKFCNCLLKLCYYHTSLNYCLRVLNSCSTTSTASSTTLPPSTTASVEPTTLTSTYVFGLSIKEKEFCNCLLNLCYNHMSLSYCLRVLKSCSTTSTTSSPTLPQSTTASVEPSTLTSTSRVVDLSNKEKEFCICLLKLCYYHKFLNYCLRVLNSCSTMSTTSSTTLSPSITASVEPTTITPTYGLVDLSIREKKFCNCLLKLCYYHTSLNYCLRVLNSCSTTSTASSTTLPPSTTVSVEPTTLTSTYVVDLSIKEKEFCNCLLNLCHYHMSLNYCLRVLKSCSTTTTASSPTLPQSTTASVEPSTLTSTSRVVDLSNKEKEFCICLLKLCYYHTSLNYCLRVLNSCSTMSITSSTTLPPSTVASVEPTTITSTYGLVDLSVKEKEFCNCLLNLCYYYKSLSYCLRVFNSCSTTSTTSSSTLPSSTTAFVTSTTPSSLSSTVFSTSSVEVSKLTPTSGLVDLSTKEKEFCNCLLNLCYYHKSLSYCLHVFKSCSTTLMTPSPTLPPSTTASVEPTTLFNSCLTTSTASSSTLPSSKTAFVTSTMYSITPSILSGVITPTSSVEQTTLTSASVLVDLSTKEKEFCNCLLKLCNYHKSLNYCIRVLKSCSTTSTTSPTLPPSTTVYVTTYSITSTNFLSTTALMSSVEPATLISTFGVVDLSTKATVLPTFALPSKTLSTITTSSKYTDVLTMATMMPILPLTTDTLSALIEPSSIITSMQLYKSSAMFITASLKPSKFTSFSYEISIFTSDPSVIKTMMETPTIRILPTSISVINNVSLTTSPKYPLEVSTMASSVQISTTSTFLTTFSNSIEILSIVTSTQLFDSSTMFITASLTPSELSSFSYEFLIFTSDLSITETMIENPITRLVSTSISATTELALTTSPKYPLPSFETSTKTMEVSIKSSSVQFSATPTFSTAVSNSTETSTIVTPTQLFDSSTMFVTVSLTPSELSSFSYEFSMFTSDPSVTKTMIKTPIITRVPTSVLESTKVALITSPRYRLTSFESSTKTIEVSTMASSVPPTTTSSFSIVVSNSAETSSIVTPTQLFDSLTMFITASLTRSELSLFSYEFSIFTSDLSITKNMMETPSTKLVPTNILVTTELALTTSPKYPLTLFEASTKTTEVSTVASLLQILTTSTFSTVNSNSFETVSIVTPTRLYDSSALYVTALLKPSELSSFSYEFLIKTSDSSITEIMMEISTTKLIPASISVTTEVILTTSPNYPLTSFETSANTTEVLIGASIVEISTTSTFSTVVSNSFDISSFVTLTKLFDSSTMTASELSLLTVREFSSFSYEFSIKTSDSSIIKTMMETSATKLVPTSISVTTEVILTTSPRYPLSSFETSIKTTEVSLWASSVPISTTSTFSTVVSNSFEISSIVTPIKLYDSSTIFITASLTPSELSSFSYEFSIFTSDPSVTNTMIETPTITLYPTNISVTNNVLLITSPKYPLTSFETLTKKNEVSTVTSLLQIFTTSTLSTVISNSFETVSIVTPTQLYDSSAMFVTASLKQTSFSYEFSIKTSDSSITEIMMETSTTKFVPTSISLTTEVILAISPKYPLTSFDTSTNTTKVLTVASLVQISTTSTFSTVVANIFDISSSVTPSKLFDSSTMFITALLTASELSLFSNEFSIITSDSSITKTMMETSATKLVPTSISVTTEVILTKSPKYPLISFETSIKTTEVSLWASSVPISTTSTFSTVVSNSFEISSIVTSTHFYDSSTMFITASLTPSELSSFSYEFSIFTSDPSVLKTMMETPTTTLVPTSILVTNNISLTTSPKYPLTLFETSTKTEVSTMESSMQISTSSTFSTVVSNSTETSSIVTPTQLFDSSTMFITASLTPSELSSFSYEYSIFTSDPSDTNTMMETTTVTLVSTSVSESTKVALITSLRYRLTSFESLTIITEVSTMANSVLTTTTPTFSTVVSISIETSSIVTPTQLFDSSTMFITASLTRSELSLFSYEYSIFRSDPLVTETMMETFTTTLVATSISVTTEVVLTTSPKYPLTSFETSTKTMQISTITSSVQISTTSTFSILVSNSTKTSLIVTPSQLHDSSTMFITASLTQSDISSFSSEFSIKISDSSITEDLMETPSTKLVLTSTSVLTEVVLITLPKYPLTSFEISPKTHEVSAVPSSVQISTTSTFLTAVSNSTETSSIVTPTQLFDSSTMFITASLTPSELSLFSYEYSIFTSDPSVTKIMMETPTITLVPNSVSGSTEVALITSPRYRLTSFESSIIITEVSTMANSVLTTATPTFSTVVSISIETSSFVTPTQLFDSSTMFITASLTPSELSSFSYEYLLLISDPSVTNTMMETPTVRLVSTSVSESTEVALITSLRYRLTSFESSTITTEVSTVASSVQISATSIFSKVVLNSTETSSIVTPAQLFDSSTMFITASLTPSKLSSFSYEYLLLISDPSVTNTMMETPTVRLVSTSVPESTEVALITSLRYRLTSFESSTVRTQVSTVVSSVQISATSIFSKVVSNSTETSSIVTPAQLFDSSTMFITASLTPSEISSFSYEYSLFISDPSVTNTMMETPTVRLVSTSVSESTEVALLTSPRYRLTSIESATKSTEVSTVASSVQISATSIFSKVVLNSTETSSIVTPAQLFDSSTILITASLTQSDISSFSSEVSIKISDSSITEDLMETPSTKLVLPSTLVLTEVVLITSLRYQLTSFESSTVRTEVSTVASSVQISATSIFSKVVSNSTETSSIVTPAQLFDSSTMFITASLTPSEISSFSYEYSLFISDPSVINTMMETPTVRLVSTSVSESTEVALLTSPRYRLTSIKSATITTEVSTVASSVQISATSIFSKVISNNTETSSIFTPIQLHDSSIMFIGASLTRSGLLSFLDEFPIKTSDSSNTETMMDTPTTLLVLTSTSVITEVASTTSPKYPSTLFETSTKSTEVSTVASSVQISATSIFSKVVLNSTETSSIVTPTQLFDSSTMFITASLTPSELSSFSYEYSIFIFDPSATNTMMETPTVRLVSTSVTESTEVALITSPRYRLTSIESSTITTDVSTVANSVQFSAKSIFSKVVSNSTETLSIFTPIQLHDSSTMFIGPSLTRSGLSSFLDEFPIKTSDSSNTETMMDTPTKLLVLTSTSVITEVALTTSPKYPSTLFETVTKSNEVSTLASSVQISAISTFSTVVSNSNETSSIVTPTQLHDSSTIFITASLTPSEISTFSHEFSIFTSAPITNKTDALVLVTSTLATEYSSTTYETETEVLTDSFKVLHTFPVTLISTNVAIITTTAALSATTIPLTLSSSTILTTASATTSNEFLFTSLQASTSAESELTTLITASTVFTTTVATTTNVSRIISSTSFEIVIPAYLTNNKEIKLFYIILVKLISGSTLGKRRHPSSYTWEEIGNHTDGLYLVGILEATSKITKFIVGKGSSRKRRDTS
ncbi:mucin-3A isoform X3 [Hydra vulgaris]|uniref:mucin-3A isoform X3 n=1 Tax=Hydra vulgaris TaxID=6087 RepID=UPI0032EA182D